ncbi:hypothetical protein E1A91_D07G144000v1 [Gossypium mustelinum]|uniref:Pectinesterase inhibitor domain-containing protein n=3 Tax=Gossypium TaxID=3633 RepID=A0A5J5QT33_GOSBA|nr:hypothetical protein ES319_D07G140400v1 [Gossypium barbadense]PPD68100.1 hypothetical protein GOBAR_DD35020 [Gossypium barbadense]TYG61457.1 hypothetical protein ES288_D07G149800v1 [Gossypium darwinii]TYI73651.1 hypothetical protein E1A91_D07G144000v1 [Gossypium mustelinum]
MKNSHISCLLFFYLLLVSANSDLIQKSCYEASKGNPANIKLDFCVSAFEGNPKAKAAYGVADLVLVSIETAIANATAIGSKISKLLDNKRVGMFARNCLKDCSELYSLAGSSLEAGLDAFQAVDYGTANAEISAALDAPVTCEDQFKEKKGLVSPLTKENNNFRQLTAIPLAFMKMVQQ